MAVQEVPAAADTLRENLQFEERFTQAADSILTGDSVLGHLRTLGENFTIDAVEHIPELISAVLVGIASYGIYRVVYFLLQRILRQTRYVRLGVETLVLQALRLLSMTTIGILVLGQMGFNIATIIAGVGIAGIALSFAARDTLENIMSGVSILADASFGKGDFVIVQATYGSVQEITLRSTRIRTPKNEVMVVPNKIMATEVVLCHSTASPLRLELPFSIAYEESPDVARDVVVALADDDDRLRLDQRARVVVTSLGESGIDMTLWLYPKHVSQQRELTYDYNERILEALREAGISIPYPHIHLKTDQPMT